MLFWGIAGFGVATMAALRLTLPAIPAPEGGNAMSELRVLKRGSVLGALALTESCQSFMSFTDLGVESVLNFVCLRRNFGRCYP